MQTYLPKSGASLQFGLFSKRQLQKPQDPFAGPPVGHELSLPDSYRPGWLTRSQALARDVAAGGFVLQVKQNDANGFEVDLTRKTGQAQTGETDYNRAKYDLSLKEVSQDYGFPPYIDVWESLSMGREKEGVTRITTHGILPSGNVHQPVYQDLYDNLKKQVSSAGAS